MKQPLIEKVDNDLKPQDQMDLEIDEDKITKDKQMQFKDDT